MRTMLLSFKPYVYEKLLSGEKIFEHRKVFPNEPIKAYMYVSAPICAIKGILYLGKKHHLEDWKRMYSNDEEALLRINNYLKTQKYAMEIEEVHETTEISLRTLRDELEHFVVPQMYYYIDDSELLKYIESKIVCTGKIIKHNFDNISSDLICRN